MGLLIRIARIVNYSAALVYLIELIIDLSLVQSDNLYIYTAVCCFCSLLITVRFIYAYTKLPAWEPDVAYNWGILLVLSRSIVFQVGFVDSKLILVSFILTVLQIMFVYKGATVILLNVFFLFLAGIRLIQIENQALLVMMCGFVFFGIGIKPLLKHLLGEIAIKDAMFKKARWAASELTDVLLHFDTRLDDVKEKTRLEMSRHLAREIHDSVGYMMTALIVQIGVVREISESSDVKAALLQLENMARETLQEIRVEVTDLRNRIHEPKPRVNIILHITQLCSIFSELTGVTINLQIQEEAKLYLAEELKEPLSKIIQEAVTNSYRHGMASLIKITILYDQQGEQILLNVSDNGKGCSNIVPGNGLSGIIERIEALHGEVAFISMAGKGFDLGIDLPVAGVEG